MAIQEKVNPSFVNEPRHFNGKSVTAVTVVLGVDVSAELGPDDAIQGSVRAMTQAATPILMSGVDLATGTFDLYFEGDFYSMGEFGADNDLTFAEWLQAEVRAFDAAVTADLSGATVAFQDPAKYGLVAETPIA